MKYLILLVSFFTLIANSSTSEHRDRNESQYNNQYTVVLDGLDPVSYFNRAAQMPKEGQSSLQAKFGSRVYFFASMANADRFEGNPLRFEPTYGSWCAWAMANGRKAQIDPTLFTIANGRLNVFASASAKRNFDRDIQKYQVLADENWFNFSGERPRY